MSSLLQLLEQPAVVAVVDVGNTPVQDEGSCYLALAVVAVVVVVVVAVVAEMSWTK